MRKGLDFLFLLCSNTEMTVPSESPGFTPVPVRARRDGWTPARQAAFIAALRGCRCVVKAARGVGLSAESAYRLARRPGAESFRRAWNDALGGHGPRPGAARPAGVPSWSLLGMMAALAPRPAPKFPSARVRDLPQKTHGSRELRRLRELPADRELRPEPGRQAAPAYSAEAFARMLRRSFGRPAAALPRGERSPTSPPTAPGG